MMPSNGSGPTKLHQVEISDVSDLLVLGSGDTIIVNTTPSTIPQRQVSQSVSYQKPIVASPTSNPRQNFMNAVSTSETSVLTSARISNNSEKLMSTPSHSFSEKKTVETSSAARGVQINSLSSSSASRDRLNSLRRSSVSEPSVHLPNAVVESDSKEVSLKENSIVAAPIPVTSELKEDLQVVKVADVPAESSESDNAFIPRPVLPEKYELIMSNLFKRVRYSNNDAYKPGGGTEWKYSGLISNVKVYAMADTASNPPNTTPDDSFAGAKGDYVIPYPLEAIADYIINDPGSRNELDPQMDKSVVVEKLSPSCNIERMMLKGVFPTDPRDFATIAGWELQQDGTLYICSTSIEHPKIPLAKGYVRGRLDYGGWVIRPVTVSEYNSFAAELGVKTLPSDVKDYKVCKVTYIFHTSIGGKIPKMVVQTATTAQAKLPMELGKKLDKRYAGVTGQAKLRSIPELRNPIDPNAPKPTAPPSSSTLVADVPAPSSPPKEKKKKVKSFPRSNFSGVWRIDPAVSDKLDDLLVEMGVPWVARKIAAKLEVVSTVKHTPTRFRSEDASSFGVGITEYSLDWVPVEIVSPEGKKTVVRGCQLPHVDSIAGKDIESTVESYLALSPEKRPTGPFAPVGPGSGVIVTVSTLPDGLGTSKDIRFLEKPGVIRLTTYYFNAKGELRVTLNRVMRAEGPPPEPFTGTGVEGEDEEEEEEEEELVLAAKPSGPVETVEVVMLDQKEDTSEQFKSGPAVVSPYNHANWIPDALAYNCHLCMAPFTRSNRVHHCRICGQAFCGACSTARVAPSQLSASELAAAKLSAHEPVRTCDICAIPVITSCTVVGSAGGIITLTGRNFGAKSTSSHAVFIYGGSTSHSKRLGRQQGERCPGKVTVGPSHTGLSFRIPPGVGSRILRLEIEGRSGTFPFKYKPLSCENIAPVGHANNSAQKSPFYSGCPTEGGEMIVEGTEFPLSWADLQFGGVSAKVNGNPVNILRISVPGKSLVVQVPAGSGDERSNYVEILVEGSGGSTIGFAYAPPEVILARLGESAAPNSNGEESKLVPTVSLIGSSFGANVNDLSVEINGEKCDFQLVVSHCKIRALLPPSLTKILSGMSFQVPKMEVVVTVKGQTSAPFVITP